MRMARNIYHRKDGRFEGRYIKSYDESGKAKLGSVFGKTYHEVKERLARMQQPLSGAATVPAITVTGAAAAYLETLKHRIKPSTQAVYRRYLENHIASFFGHIPCEGLTTELMQGFVNRQMAQGLSAGTIQAVVSFLHAGLTACGCRIHPVKLPKKIKKTVQYFSLDEQKRLELAAKKSSEVDYLTIMLSLYTGVRIGELCGLRWTDIDFECRLLRVRRTLQRIRLDGAAQTELAFLSPKTESSARDIPLPDFLLEMLREQYTYATGDYIVSLKGKAIEPRTLQRRFKRLLSAAKVKQVNYHTTRHTFATRALESGFDVKSLSEILGHGSATITLQKYAHALDEHKRSCMNGLYEVFMRVR